jgi:hypothetical protein
MAGRQRIAPPGFTNNSKARVDWMTTNAVAAGAVFRHDPGGTMPLPSENSPLGAFLAALREEGIDCILIEAMAAIRRGAPLMTVDYDFWVRLPEREYVRLVTLVC